MRSQVGGFCCSSWRTIPAIEEDDRQADADEPPPELGEPVVHQLVSGVQTGQLRSSFSAAPQEQSIPESIRDSPT